MELTDKVKQILNRWRNNKGVGTIDIPVQFDGIPIIMCILQRMYTKNEYLKTIIVTNTFADRVKFAESITHQEDENNNKAFKELLDSHRLTIITENHEIKKEDVYDFCILYNIGMRNLQIFPLLDRCKFKLNIQSRAIFSSAIQKQLYIKCPMCGTITAQDYRTMRLSTPVEDMHCGVVIPENTDDYKVLNYYNQFIDTSLSIFGSLDIMHQANTGNKTLNVSAMQICNQIATENGWNEHLDMSIEYNRNIDSLYNPSMLRERAGDTYDIIRKRSTLLADNSEKLDTILNIVKDNIDKKILIINKRAEFATIVSNYINDNIGRTICEPYHDKLEKIAATDDNGNPICFKVGPNAGKQKMLGCRARRVNANQRFNDGKINIISTNNTPDKTLECDVDIVIITSSQCNTIQEYLYRLQNVNFGNKISLYTIYIENSLEEKKLLSHDYPRQHKIINNCKNMVVDEKNSDFIVVD